MNKNLSMLFAMIFVVGFIVAHIAEAKFERFEYEHYGNRYKCKCKVKKAKCKFLKVEMFQNNQFLFSI